ncbi:hypothetical protein [Sphingobium yanoikuyae]|uniref:hypothetical protein n=1 Tax=Sphingobium yanoikuyae TaxID=13690 RepID=UPI0028AE1FB9|nr:hypothetical protein [Sphingobium yanoikuyae]
MIASEDIFSKNLGVFLDLLDPIIGIEEGPEELIEMCGDRDEIVAYLVFNSSLLKNDQKIKQHLFKFAQITPKSARPTAAAATPEDTAKISAHNDHVTEMLSKILRSELSSSSLVKELEKARFYLAAQRASDGSRDDTIFDRIASPN